MCLLGQVQDGMYVDEHQGVHPDVLNQYYGVHGPRTERGPGETGAGQLPDEEVPGNPILEDMDDEDWDDLDDRVEMAHADNFHHDPVPVPKHANPFDDEMLQTFHQVRSVAEAQGVVPEGYGLLPTEWEGEGYPAYEILKSGRRGGKELRIALPDFIWRPRAEMWGRALDILNQLNYINED